MFKKSTKVPSDFFVRNVADVSPNSTLTNTTPVTIPAIPAPQHSNFSMPINDNMFVINEDTNEVNALTRNQPN